MNQCVTLFILVADHSHNSYRNWHPYSPNYRRIPLLFCGSVIKDEYKGTKWAKIGSQSDIASTLLAQMDLDATNFHWGRNLFNPHIPEFAYYAFEQGIGWIRPSGYFVYQQLYKKNIFEELKPNEKDSLIREGKSFLQLSFQEYLDL